MTTAAQRLRLGLRRLRVSQPFNRLATGLVRAALSVFRGRSDLAVRHLHRVGPVESRLPDGQRLRLWSRADDWVSNQVYWRGWSGYEPETSPLFYELATRAEVTLDVGAYVGFFTLLAAHANPAGRVYAFEPLPQAFARLSDHVRRNALTNVVAVPIAVGRQEAEAEFFHVSGESAQSVASDGRASIPCSSSLSEDFMRGAQGVVSTRVQVTTLDQYLAKQQAGRVDLVKIDTESTEPDVLLGMHRRLEASQPDIFCEVLSSVATGPRLLDQLVPLGYRAYLLTPEGPLARDRVEGHPQWLNYLFSVQPAERLAGLHRRAGERQWRRLA